MRRTLLAVVLVGVAFIGVAAVIGLRAQPRVFAPPFRHARAFAAQFSRQRASPHESTIQKVAGATLTITYGRPSMRGREIFGSLVPYERVWCPGADEATTLEATRPIQIGTVVVPVGPHTIWILPTPDQWTLIISREPEGFHTLYNRDADLGRVELAKRDLPRPIEQLTFEIRPGPSSGGMIAMLWEKTEVSVPFHVTGT